MPKGKKKDRNTEAILVTATGKTYAELLREMKTKVNVAKLGIEIQGIRSSRRGEVLLETKKDGGDAITLANEIKKCMDVEGLLVKKAGGQMRSLHLRGIDGDMEAEEVIKGLKAAMGPGGEKVEVRALRQAFGGRKNAIVVAEKETADKLKELERVKIGWTTCRITEMAAVDRCHRCWCTGHKQESCTGKDRRKACLKCAKEGHFVKECKEDPYCPICEETGHRADSMRCPVYRKEARRREDRDTDTDATRRRGTRYGGHDGADDMPGITDEQSESGRKESDEIEMLLEKGTPQQEGADLKESGGEDPIIGTVNV